jgi:hypothetical protein
MLSLLLWTAIENGGYRLSTYTATVDGKHVEEAPSLGQGQVTVIRISPIPNLAKLTDLRRKETRDDPTGIKKKAQESTHSEWLPMERRASARRGNNSYTSATIWSSGRSYDHVGTWA